MTAATGQARLDRVRRHLEQEIGGDGIDRYEAALARLRPEERQAIVARLERQQSYQQLATALGQTSPDAARRAVARAVTRLVRVLDGE